MSDWLFDLVSGFGWVEAQYEWMVVLAFVVGATLLAHIVGSFLLHFLQRRADATSMQLDSVLIGAAKPPLVVLIWVVGVVTGLQVAVSNGSLILPESVGTVRKLALIATISWFAVRLVSRLERILMRPAAGRKAMDVTTVRVLGRLVRLSVLVLAALIVMQNLGFSVSGILAFGGIGGLAVGFAAKDLLANFFGGLMIYLDRPFNVGDWIRSPDKEIEGVVEDIGWRQTRIRTFSKRPLYVPNATFASISVENPSRMTNRRIYEYVGVRYDDSAKVQQILDRVRAMLEAHPAIDTNQTLMVNLDRFGPSSLDFFIYTFTKTTDWVEFHGIKQDVLMRVISIVETAGAEIAFPTTTVHVAEMPVEPIARKA
ncbi:mechanosensitive ion channel family protein [Pontibacterium granulatum]|uniref:mechanosensitive ion channel family protein n=1 Tax=Pontibacterium granulatum TaxID=2036029 RepID=UPI002499E55B|nr:mechanosensitive ion channel family protein [Pontibacterium granulatum]MDI3326073.1 mechanosensitive ion channel family protein [Pontibacterium granulatum]